MTIILLIIVIIILIINVIINVIIIVLIILIITFRKKYDYNLKHKSIIKKYILQNILILLDKYNYDLQAIAKNYYVPIFIHVKVFLKEKFTFMCKYLKTKMIFFFLYFRNKETKFFL